MNSSFIDDKPVLWRLLMMPRSSFVIIIGRMILYLWVMQETKSAPAMTSPQAVTGSPLILYPPPPQPKNTTIAYLIKNRSPFGGVDGKVTSYKLIQQGIAYGQSGPSHDQLPFFNWQTANFPTAVHQVCFLPLLLFFLPN